MTAAGLEKTLALLQLRPARLVARGLASRKLLKGEAATLNTALDSSSSGSGITSSNPEVEEEEKENTSHVSESNSSTNTTNSSGSYGNDNETGHEPDTQARKRLIHAA